MKLYYFNILLAVLFVGCASKKELKFKLPPTYTGWVYVIETDSIKKPKHVAPDLFYSRKVNVPVKFISNGKEVKFIYAFKTYLKEYIKGDWYTAKDAGLFVNYYYFPTPEEWKMEHRLWSTKDVFEPLMEITRKRLHALFDKYK